MIKWINMGNLRNGFFTGLIVLLPIVVTIYVMRLVLIAADDVVIGPMIKLAGTFIPFKPIDQRVLVFLAKASVFFLAIVSVTLFGLAMRMILFKQLLSAGEKLLVRVPLVSKIYFTIQQISHAFLGQKQVFQRTVLLDYPRKGLQVIGFVTSEARGEIQSKKKEKLVNVFVPTTPNPTSGFFLIVPEREVVNLKMSVEDGMKLVVSGGVVSPRFLDQRTQS